MFGMVAANGIKVLSKVDFVKNHHNLFIVAVSIGLGLVPVVSPHFFAKLPPALSPPLHSGILLASVSAVVLNLIFNGVKGERAAKSDIRRAGHDFDGRAKGELPSRDDIVHTAHDFEARPADAH